MPVRPSGSVPFGMAALSFLQVAGRPRRQPAQVPHEGAHESTTSSPGRTRVTAEPTSSTTPAPSCPSTIGVGRRNSPFTWWRSVPQMPTAAMRTTTSSGRGSSRSISAISKGCPTAWKRAARVFIGGGPGRVA